ncbi:hypothetical protein BH24ACI4_BH24ACI4_21260 [soil metagenome]|jgi:hypothetical protein
MRTGIITISIAGLVLICAGAAAQQEMRSTPGPGSGTTGIRGTVDIGNIPPVQAVQSGDWRVAVSNVPTVTMAAPPFVHAGSRYLITWPTGESETVTIAQPGPGGWVRVEPTAEGRARWINLATARSISEMQ